MSKVCVGRNPMTLVARTRGGASSYGHNSVGSSRGSPRWCLRYQT